MDVSIIIPSFNEKESLPELLDWIRQVMEREGLEYEAIVVDDGSTDGTWESVRRMAGADPRVKGIRFRRNYGKSAALFCGFRKAVGEIVVTMDADPRFGLETAPQGQQTHQEPAFEALQCHGPHDHRHQTARHELWSKSI